ncbi:MAG: glycosyltransferase family 4 protein [Muribaculaceae bacterium]
MSVLLLTDTEEGYWSFEERLGDSFKVDCRHKATNRPEFHKNKLGTLRRYFHYFAFPLKFALKRNQGWECMVAWQQFFGLNTAFWSRLLHLPKKAPLLTMTFIYNPKAGLAGKIYGKYIKYCLTGGYIDKVICYSPQECESYSRSFGISPELFAFVPLGISKAEGPELHPVKGDYVFSTGRSNRDFTFLVDALKDRYDLRIATQGFASPAAGSVRKLEILDNCFGDDMLRRMSESLCVVIPLDDISVSSGQLVVLQAMRMGKPVIVTENVTMSTYIDNGKTGFIIPKDKDELLRTIDRLASDSELYEKVSRCQRETFLKKFTEEALADRIADIIRQVK